MHKARAFFYVCAGLFLLALNGWVHRSSLPPGPASSLAIYITDALLTGLAGAAVAIWPAIQIYDRLVVRIKVKVHPGILFRKPHRFEDVFREIVTEGVDPTKIIVTRPPEVAVASAQGFKDVPADARDAQRALFVRVYNLSPKQQITVSQVWFEGMNGERTSMDGPAGAWEGVPAGSYRESWVLVSKLPQNIPKEEQYRRFRAQIVGRRDPILSEMADPREVGPRGDLAVEAAREKDW